MTLREKAQNWLDGYKAGKDDENNQLLFEDWAAIIGEYLHDRADVSETIGDLKGDLERLEEEKRQLCNKITSLTKENESFRYSCDMSKQRLNFAEGKIAAYEFAIRCNGVSGSEVKNA